jgi:hypothetical protein
MTPGGRALRGQRAQWGAAARRDGGSGCHQASSGAGTRPCRGGAAASNRCVSVRWWIAHETAP